MDLNEYRHKRKFNSTPEPQAYGDLKFVIQKHAASRLHFDFRLEAGGVLKSWAVPKGVSMDPRDARLAIKVEDHPYDYKDFEGTIPSGNYGAGTVMIWDRGTYVTPECDRKEVCERSVAQGLEAGKLHLILNGSKAKGGFVLIKTEARNHWLLKKIEDAYARAPILLRDQSVVSQKTLEQINSADLIKPMLAVLSKEPFNSDDWIFELKLDGYRAVADIREGDIRLYSRNGISFSERFPVIVEALKKIQSPAVIDGELVVVDPAGRPNFQLMQNYLKNHEGTVLFYAFDILSLDSQKLVDLPLLERKKILKTILPRDPRLRFTEHIESHGVEFFKETVHNGLEGIVAKKKNSKYRPGRRVPDWLKIKSSLREEAVIAGFTEPRGGRKDLGALILGTYDGERLRYIGHTGGGFSAEELHAMRAKLEPLVISDSPFAEEPKTNNTVHWVKPHYVCEVAFSEWTKDGLMRQPIFLGLLEVKAIGDLKKEEPLFEITNRDKIYWPEEKYTKGDLMNYYERMAGMILPYAKDRPQTLYRFPEGISGSHFYQKNVDGSLPTWVTTVPIFSEAEKRKRNYLVVERETDIVYLAQLGCIEINPWNSKIGTLDHPEFLIIDLDPLDTPFSAVVLAAREAHKLLEELLIPNYCKTSGATGLHIYIPLGSKYTYEQATPFAKLLATLINERIPKIGSIERSPEKRRGKVYLDYLQNRKGQTVVSPYSVRPLRGAPVSAPLWWTEVNDKLNPSNFDMRKIFARLDKIGDPWRQLLKDEGVNMKEVLDMVEKIVAKKV